MGRNRVFSVRLCALGASVVESWATFLTPESQSSQSCTELLATHGLISFEEHSSAGLVIQPSSSDGIEKMQRDAKISLNQISLFFRAASSVSVVSHEGDQKDVLSFPFAE